MKLRTLIQIVILISHLYGLSSAADLPKLKNNKLDEGKDRELPQSNKIKCGKFVARRVKVSSTKNPSSVLTSTIFARDAFTSGPIRSDVKAGPGRKYRFAVLHGDKILYALETNPSGEAAYWLPQGGTIDIPRNPKKDQPKYVFTADFSGCSWTVTPKGKDVLRLRHVEGTKEADQFNKLTEAQKGGPVTYAIQYRDYGYLKESHDMTSHIQGYAFMHYKDGKWFLSVQSKTCCPDTGGYTYDKNGVLTGLIMNEAKQKRYRPISRSKTYTVPH